MKIAGSGSASGSGSNLVRVMDLRIRIHAKMSCLHNSDCYDVFRYLEHTEYSRFGIMCIYVLKVLSGHSNSRATVVSFDPL